MRRRKILRQAAGAGLAALLAAALAVLAGGAYALAAAGGEDPPLPQLFGNFTTGRGFLERAAPKKEFRFGVIGDTHSKGTAARLFAELVRTGVDFVVLLGDAAYSPTRAHHRFLRAQLADGWPFSCPVFFVPGNHDADERRFSTADFERDYGPAVFSFSYQGCLFAFLNCRDQGPAPGNRSLDLLGRLAADRPQRYRRRFVFCHQGAPLPRELKTGGLPYWPDAAPLLRSLRPDYFFSGNYHGYFREQREGAVFLVTGGGGQRPETEPFPQFHHALVVTVAEDGVREQILAGGGSRRFTEWLRLRVFTQVYPWLEAHPAQGILAGAAALLMALAAVGGLVRLRRGREAAGGPGAGSGPR